MTTMQMTLLAELLPDADGESKALARPKLPLKQLSFARLT